MGTITVRHLAESARIMLQDAGDAGDGVRWKNAEILRWANDGQREIVTVHPQAWTKTARVPLVAGDTRQTLQTMGLTDGLQIIRPVRNFDAAGTVPGRSVTKVAWAMLDQTDPDWHGTTGPAVVHYVTEPQDQTAIYVYPAPATATRMEVIYSALPPAVASIDGAISLDDVYANALTYFILSRMLAKRSAANTSALSQAAGYYNLMLQTLGVKAQVSLGTDTTQTTTGSAA